MFRGRFAKTLLVKSALLSRWKSVRMSPIQSVKRKIERFVVAFEIYSAHNSLSNNQVCEDVVTEQCKEVEKEVCSPKTVTECNDVTTEVCESVPKEVCNVEKKIVMVERTEEECAEPEEDSEEDESSEEVVSVSQKAVKASNSYLPPPPTNAGEIKTILLCKTETSEILVSREFSRFFFSIITSGSRSRAVSISLSLLEKSEGVLFFTFTSRKK